MSKNTVIEIISYWLPDIINSLVSSLEKECLLIIKKSKGRNTGFSDIVSLDFSPQYLDKIKNFKWIKIDNNTYTFCHFKKFFNILETYAFAFSNIKELTFHPDLDYNIFCVYILIYCLYNDITILNYSKNLDRTFIVCDYATLDIKNPDYMICLDENDDKYNLFLNISHDKYQIKNIKRWQYPIYNYLNFNYNYYTLPVNKKYDCGYKDKLQCKTSGYVNENLKKLPMCILFRFIKACYFFLKQYSFLHSQNTIDKNNSNKIIELIWCDNISDVHEVFNSQKPINNKIFNITILANTSDNYFYTKITYISFLLKYAPYSVLIRNNFNQLTYSVDSLYISPIVHKNLNYSDYHNINIYQLLLIMIIVFSLMLKYIITFKKKNHYDYIKLDLPLCDVDNLLNKISLIYLKQSLYYPFIIKWDPNPSLITYQKNNNPFSIYIILVLEEIINKYVKFNFITSNIINIRIFPSLDEWCDGIRFNDLNEIYNNKQYLLLTKTKNKILVEGKCDLFVRKILNSIKDAS